MELSHEVSGVGQDNSELNSGELETAGLSHLETGFLEFQRDTDEHVPEEIIDLENQRESNDLFGSFAKDDDYSPSIFTDFSGFLPGVSLDEGIEISKNYDPEVIVQSAWKSLSQEGPKLPWESNFWERFLDPNVSAMDMLERGYKRPAPVPFFQEPSTASAEEVERRVLPKPIQEVKGFLQHIRDIPERSWKEEREALWETSVRRWIALTDAWAPGCSRLVDALHGCPTFKEKAQILVDVFYNKAPQTLIKRVNSLQRFCKALQRRRSEIPLQRGTVLLLPETGVSKGSSHFAFEVMFRSLGFCQVHIRC